MRVVLIDGDGRQVRSMADPAGGTFDAVGDFGRLLGSGSGAVRWSAIDPNGTTTMTGRDVPALLQELPVVAQQARRGREERGLARLTAMARLCESMAGATLLFEGD